MRAALAVLAAALAWAGPREERLRVFRDQIKEALAAVEANQATPTTRDLPNAALTILALGGDARDAERLALASFAHQDMDANSPGFGTIPWQVGHPEIKDANSIEFNMQPVGPILLGYGDALSGSFKQEMLPHIRAAFAAIRRHKVPVTYTNIFLMKTVNLILAGEAIGDREAAQDGYALLDQWIDHTRRAGIGEFDSPNYYGVTLNSLLMGYRYAARAGAREKFKRVLDLFWSDIAANYFAGRGTLSGPHSRGYDFLGGHETIELFLYQEGLRKTPSSVKPAIGRIFLLQNELAEGYRPGDEILRLAALPERIVESRWRAELGHERYNYVTPEFAIGSANGHYGTHDKLVNIELASNRDLPAIYVAPDATDHPYGRLRYQDRSGHQKPVHVPLNAVSVQHKGALLVLLDLDPSALAETTSFATNIVLPARADRIALDGRPVKVAGEFERAVRLDSVVGVRAGKADLAVRLFAADGALVLKADADGLANGALRLTAYHHRGPNKKLTATHVRVGILFLAGRLAARAREAVIEQSQDASSWKVRAQVGSLTLEAARDLNTRQALYRRVNGTEVASHVLAVNGRDLAGPLLEAQNR